MQALANYFMVGSVCWGIKLKNSFILRKYIGSSSTTLFRVAKSYGLDDDDSKVELIFWLN